ncbi:unnamed protein product [Prorocentrum cordatum]|uniref:Phospholipase B-like n=1 Tax=Prorocentrum cordatum TaxID=2364126 RepID=A0ABN9U0Q0_9DINO|nr:unnamed protein product [Polarella glacialis]
MFAPPVQRVAAWTRRCTAEALALHVRPGVEGARALGIAESIYFSFLSGLVRPPRESAMAGDFSGAMEPSTCSWHPAVHQDASAGGSARGVAGWTMTDSPGGAINEVEVDGHIGERRCHADHKHYPAPWSVIRAAGCLFAGAEPRGRHLFGESDAAVEAISTLGAWAQFRSTSMYPTELPRWRHR